MALLGRCLAPHRNPLLQGPARSALKPGPVCFVRRPLRVYSSLEQGEGTPPLPTVSIRVNYRVNFGEVLRVVGSSSVFGDWTAQNGLQLNWTDGDVWTAEVPVHSGFYEFKCVVYNTETGSVSRWEDGGNRVLNIPQEQGKWVVECAWGATADMTQAFTPAPPPPPPPAPEPVAEAAPQVEAPQGEASPAEESLPAFMALSDESDQSKDSAALESSGDASGSPLAASTAASGAAAALDAAEASGSGRGAGGAVAFLLATCAAGAVAAAAVLAPGGLSPSAPLGGLGGRANELLNTTVLQSTLAGAQVRAQVQTQLSALAGHVSAVQAGVAAVSPAVQAGYASVQAQVAPAVQAGVASVQGGVADGLASLEPMVRSGAALVQGQAGALQAKAADAVGLMGAAPQAPGRQG